MGSVSLSGEFLAGFTGEVSGPRALDEFLRRLDRQDFNLVAMGHQLIVDPTWVTKIQHGRSDELKGYGRGALRTLV